MGYTIKQMVQDEIEVRELGFGEYFEWDGSVYQRLGVARNLIVKLNQCESYPIYAICLTSGLITYFSSDGKTIVTRLYETSPLVLSWQKP